MEFIPATNCFITVIGIQQGKEERKKGGKDGEGERERERAKVNNRRSVNKSQQRLLKVSGQVRKCFTPCVEEQNTKMISHKITQAKRDEEKRQGHKQHAADQSKTLSILLLCVGQWWYRGRGYKQLNVWTPRSIKMRFQLWWVSWVGRPSYVSQDAFGSVHTCT